MSCKTGISSFLSSMFRAKRNNKFTSTGPVPVPVMNEKILI